MGMSMHMGTFVESTTSSRSEYQESGNTGEVQHAVTAVIMSILCEFATYTVSQAHGSGHCMHAFQGLAAFKENDGCCAAIRRST